MYLAHEHSNAPAQLYIAGSKAVKDALSAIQKALILLDGCNEEYWDSKKLFLGVIERLTINLVLFM